MRVNAKWTPSEIGLWLIAAVIATLVVCTGSSERPLPKAPPTEIEFEVDVGR